MDSKEHYLKKPSQSNHENTTIPKSVSQYYKQPLYIIIALWCQKQNRWINRNDIAQAFSITVRRASFQLSYITRRSKHINLRSRQQILSEKGKRHRCNEIWVENVIIELMETSKAKTKAERGVMGAYRLRVGNGMSDGGDIWHSLVMMRRTKNEIESE